MKIPKTVFVLTIVVLFFSLINTSVTYAFLPADAKKPHVLIYTKNGEGFVHKNIPASIKALEKLLQENKMTYESSEDPALFTKDNLQKYDLLIFSNTNNDAFDTDQQRQAFQNYIQNGGGFVGIHSASGSERNWPWYWAMLGGKFFRHSKFQSFNIVKIDPNHPAAQPVPDYWEREDESYYLKELNPDIHVILATDLASIDDPKLEEYPSNTFGKYFPVSWCHHFDGGHQWYTSLGHSPEHYDDPVFMNHILGGIQWVLDARSNQKNK